MKANELRNGNLVEYPNWNNDSSKAYFKIKVNYFEDEKISLTNGFIELPYTKVQYLEPISLSKEWLLKFGFNEELDGAMVKGDIAIFLDRRIKKNLFLRDNQDNKWFRFSCTVKYVHQLQNLYFVLSGEELTFKSE